MKPEDASDSSPAPASPEGAPTHGGVGALLEALGAAAGDSLIAVIHFGSQLVRTSPGQSSAHDLFVVVERRYGDFYPRIAAIAPAPVPAAVLAALNRCLPPNILFQPAPIPGGPGGKLFVISERDLTRSVAKGPDHFCRGRLMQRVNVAYARDEAARRRMEALLERNRRETVLWVRPYLTGSFTIGAFCLRMLEVSYGEEIRPETSERRKEVFEAQGDFWEEIYGPVLAEAASVGLLAREGGTFRYLSPAGAADRLRSRLYFLRSKIRATVRWLKYMLTFDRWLDYIAAKSERRTGVSVQLTERERKYPYLFVWPKLLRVLRARRAKPAASPRTDASPKGEDAE